MTEAHIVQDAYQDALMEEECILVDGKDTPIGKASKRIAHLNTNIAAGMLHRAFSVFIFNNEGKLLLQQRAHTKVTFPLYWTNTCCSHPLFTIPQENIEENALGVKNAAIRKLQHELNISPADLHIDHFHYLTRIQYGAPSDGKWGENEIDWILFFQTELPNSTNNPTKTLQFNPEEVEAIQWVTPEQLQSLIDQHKAGTIKLTPWFALIAEKLLFGWWNQLSSIIAKGGIGEEQRTVIHKLN